MRIALLQKATRNNIEQRLSNKAYLFYYSFTQQRLKSTRDVVSGLNRYTSQLCFDVDWNKQKNYLAFRR